MPRFPAYSPHAHGLSASVYSTLAKRARASGKPVFPLHVGDTYREPLLAARAEAQRTEAHPGLHRYSAVQGELALREAIVRKIERRHGVALGADDLQVMSGATAGLSVVSSTILDPGDEVILLSPYWPLIRGLIAVRGARPVEVPFFDRLSDSSFDPERAVTSAITDRTAALYINSPNNPTGVVATPELLAMLVRIAASRDLWVLWDDAYEDIWFTVKPPRAGWLDVETRSRSIVCNTLSKSYGLAGTRIGYTHGPARVMDAIRGVQTFQTYCAPKPSQIAAIAALDLGDAWVAEARELYAAAAGKAASTLGIRAPEGGTFLFFDASPHFRAGETILEFLGRCADAGVLLTAGTVSGADYASWARLCFTAVPPADLDDALRALKTVL